MSRCMLLVALLAVSLFSLGRGQTTSSYVFFCPYASNPIATTFGSGGSLCSSPSPQFLAADGATFNTVKSVAWTPLSWSFDIEQVCIASNRFLEKKKRFAGTRT